MKISTLFAFAALAAAGSVHGAYSGPTFDVSVWKGETLACRPPDWAEVELLAAKAPAGVDFDVGGVAPVPCSVRARAVTRTERYDRVVWRSSKRFKGLEGPMVVKLAVPADHPAGTFDIGPMRVRVLDRELPPPASWRYFLDLWQHPWAAARINGVKPFSSKHYAAMKPVYRTLADCGVKSLTVTLLDYPWNHQCYDAYHSMIGRVKAEDGSWRFDYRVFDEYVEFGRACGIGPDIACYTMCPWGYYVHYATEKGEQRKVLAKPGTPEFADFWGDFLTDFARHLKEKGWFEHAYIAMDERAPEDVMEIARFICEKAPGLRIAMAGNRRPSEFKGIEIDNYCQYIGFITPEFLAEEVPARRAKGCRSTFYVCCGPDRPNTFMESPDEEAYFLGACPALCGLDGFLRWAANSWPRDPEREAAFGTWRPGDTFLVYPDGSPSIRLLMLRSGIVAAEKLWILEKQGLFAAELADFKKKHDIFKAMKGEGDYAAFMRELEALVNRQ